MHEKRQIRRKRERWSERGLERKDSEGRVGEKRRRKLGEM
jgi:hypothetical protein